MIGWLFFIAIGAILGAAVTMGDDPAEGAVIGGVLGFVVGVFVLGVAI